jgi:ABC-2 type transport system ATP-binding protein/lipopolysaccharide transport system ATP-binding protein
MHTESKAILKTTDTDHQIPAVLLENVSVKYRLPEEHLSGFKEYVIRWLQRRISHKEFYALHNVSFQVQPGEVFGIIGQNGAGKSTMLKVMARVLHPSEGRIVMRGHTAPLLELGGGFNNELTGRENIYLNMSLLGHSRKQIDELFDSIVNFAGIRKFIDSPIRTYSTGMVARLGFAVATCVRPDILLVDEVLSVGDTSFQEKCLNRMFDFQTNGTTIVIVSHSMGTVEAFCERALWLDHGEIQAIGSVSEVIDQYLNIDKPILPAQSPHAVKTEDVELPQTQSVLSSGSYATLNSIGKIYRTDQIFNIKQGTISVWVKSNDFSNEKLAAIFHTDDSRYVLYARVLPSFSNKPPAFKVTGRAGGNRRAFDKRVGSIGFPEITATIRQDKASKEEATSINEWHLIILTWSGYPQGTLNLYTDGKLAGSHEYDPNYDDGRDLPKYLAVGMRPLNWTGEVIKRQDGTTEHLHPGSTMSLLESSLEIRDLRLYNYQFSQEDAFELYKAGYQEEGEDDPSISLTK